MLDDVMTQVRDKLRYVHAAINDAGMQAKRGS